MQEPSMVSIAWHQKTVGINIFDKQCWGEASFVNVTSKNIKNIDLQLYKVRVN